MAQLGTVLSCQLAGLETCPIFEMKKNELRETIILEKYQEQIARVAEERAKQMVTPVMYAYEKVRLSNEELLEENQILEARCRMLEEKLYSIFFGPEHARTKVEMW